MTKYTKQQQAELDRLSERIDNITKRIDSAIDEGRDIAINLVLEARHNSLSCKIIEIQAKIDSAEEGEDVERLKMRLNTRIAEAKETGRINRIVRDFALSYYKLTYEPF